MKAKTFYLAAVSVFAFTTTPGTAIGQPILNPDSSLVGDDPDGTFSAFGDAYAAAADTWGDWLFVGSPRETVFRDGQDYQDGAVYIYRKDAGGSYVFQQKLTMPGSSGLFFGGLPVGDRFGGGVEASNGWLFVGSANDADFPAGLVDPRQGIGDPADPPFVFAGQVHVYRLGGGSWNFVQTLISPTPGSFGSFGTRTQASHIALNSTARVAVIGELDNFDGGLGQLHSYRLRAGAWEHVQTVDAPDAGLDSFGDDLVFATDKYLVAGAADVSDDESTTQGLVFVYKANGNSGKLSSAPIQTIAGPVVALADCINAFSSFGGAGLDAGGGVVAVADPCATGAAGAFAGAISVYRVSGPASFADLVPIDSVNAGPVPLLFAATIEGDEPDLYFGSNAFGSRHAIAVSDSGRRILIGSPLSPNGQIEDGADVRVYVAGPGGWTEESNLTTLTPATGDLRSFGDTVFFVDDETAFVREGNFLSPVVTGLKGQGLFYDLTP